MDQKQIEELEMQIIRALIESGIREGYSVTLDDGGATPVERSRDVEVIIAAMRSVGEEHLIFYREDGSRVGAALIVYGNDGYDVIADYSMSLEPIMTEADVISELAQT